MGLDMQTELLTMYKVWSWSSWLATACLNRRTKSFKVSQRTGEVCSVPEQLCNWMRISSRRSRDVKYSTQFTNTWGSWREQKKSYNCIWLFQCKYSRKTFPYERMKETIPCQQNTEQEPKTPVKKKLSIRYLVKILCITKWREHWWIFKMEVYLRIMYKNWS